MSLAVADTLLGVSPIVGAFKEIKTLHKQIKDGSKMKSGEAVKNASEDVSTTRDYYDVYVDPVYGAQTWNGGGHMVEDYTSQRYERSLYPKACEEYEEYYDQRHYGEGYPHCQETEVHPTRHYDGEHTDHRRDQAYSIKEGHDYNQQVQEYNTNSAQQFAYSDCTSEEALRRHFARLAASKHP